MPRSARKNGITRKKVASLEWRTLRMKRWHQLKGLYHPFEPVSDNVSIFSKGFTVTEWNKHSGMKKELDLKMTAIETQSRSHVAEYWWGRHSSQQTLLDYNLMQKSEEEVAWYLVLTSFGHGDQLTQNGLHFWLSAVNRILRDASGLRNPFDLI